MSERVEYKDIDIETVAEGDDIEIIHAEVRVTVGLMVDKHLLRDHRRYGGRFVEEVERELRLRLARRIYGDLHKKIRDLEDVVRRRCHIPDSATWEELRKGFGALRNYGDDLAEKPLYREAATP